MKPPFEEPLNPVFNALSVALTGAPPQPCERCKWLEEQMRIGRTIISAKDKELKGWRNGQSDEMKELREKLAKVEADFLAYRQNRDKARKASGGRRKPRLTEQWALQHAANGKGIFDEA